MQAIETSLTYWVIREPWGQCPATDEFGNGTLNGNPAAGPSYDACGPASLENAAANYEQRAPTYVNIGHIRVDMMLHGNWVSPYSIENPRTGGCEPHHLLAELPRRGYKALDYLGEQASTLTTAQLTQARAYQRAVILMVFNAQALTGNELNVKRHYVVIAGHSGYTGHSYILNSDIAGQHGVAPGQWVTDTTIHAADPRAYIVIEHM